jgi:hypothetical protein
MPRESLSPELAYVSSGAPVGGVIAGSVIYSPNSFAPLGTYGATVSASNTAVSALAAARLENDGEITAVTFAATTPQTTGN